MKRDCPRNIVILILGLKQDPGANQDKHANIIDRNRVIRRDGFRCKICKM